METGAGLADPQPRHHLWKLLLQRCVADGLVPPCFGVELHVPYSTVRLYVWICTYYIRLHFTVMTLALILPLQVTTGLFNTTYVIPRATTIPADSTEHKVSPSPDLIAALKSKAVIYVWGGLGMGLA